MYRNLRPGFREQTRAAAEIFRRTPLLPACPSPVNRCDQGNAFSFCDSQLVHVTIQSFVMHDLFEEQLRVLRAASLDRHLSETGTAKGPEIEIAGRRFINFSSNDYLGLANDARLHDL